MKNHKMTLKEAIVFAALLLFGFSVKAQIGLNQFAGPRVILIAAGQMITGTVLSNNMTCDVHGMEGIARLDMFGATNGAETLTAWINTSSDRTNWTALANFAYASNAPVIYTNNYYGTGTPLATNNINYPGTIVTPTASSAGFATKYLVLSPFTNSAANGIAITNEVTIGFNIQDCSRYLQLVVSNSASAAEGFGAMLTALKQQE